MLGLKNILWRSEKSDDLAASIWFGAAVPLALALAVAGALLASLFDAGAIGWLFELIGSAVSGLVVAGGWVFPLCGAILARRGLKSNRNIALASLSLSICELFFYAVAIWQYLY